MSASAMANTNINSNGLQGQVLPSKRNAASNANTGIQAQTILSLNKADTRSPSEPTITSQDATTLQGILSTLMDIEFQNGDFDKALQRLDLIRELEAKPANKLSTGNLLTSVIEARKINLPSEQAYPSMSDCLSRSLFNQYN